MNRIAARIDPPKSEKADEKIVPPTVATLSSVALLNGSITSNWLSADSADRSSVCVSAGRSKPSSQERMPVLDSIGRSAAGSAVPDAAANKASTSSGVATLPRPGHVLDESLQDCGRAFVRLHCACG